MNCRRWKEILRILNISLNQTWKSQKKSIKYGKNYWRKKSLKEAFLSYFIRKPTKLLWIFPKKVTRIINVHVAQSKHLRNDSFSEQWEKKIKSSDLKINQTWKMVSIQSYPFNTEKECLSFFFKIDVVSFLRPYAFLKKTYEYLMIAMRMEAFASCLPQ